MILIMELQLNLCNYKFFNHFSSPGMEHNSTQYIHHLIEAFRLSFSDALQYCADPEKADVPINELLSKSYAAKRRKLIQPDRYVCRDSIYKHVFMLKFLNCSIKITPLDLILWVNPLKFCDRIVKFSVSIP